MGMPPIDKSQCPLWSTEPRPATLDDRPMSHRACHGHRKSKSKYHLLPLELTSCGSHNLWNFRRLRRICWSVKNFSRCEQPQQTGHGNDIEHFRRADHWLIETCNFHRTVFPWQQIRDSKGKNETHRSLEVQSTVADWTKGHKNIHHRCCWSWENIASLFVKKLS